MEISTNSSATNSALDGTNLSREFAASLFDLLHAEIVTHFFTHCKVSKEFSKEEVNFQCDQIGFNVGVCLAERLTRDIPRFREQIDVVKFLCKEFWLQVFGKQVDNLRTNHRGVYVIQDNRFRPLCLLGEGKQYLEESHKYLSLPCGLLRGVLSSVGISSIVSAETLLLPACTFQVKILTN